MSEAGAGMPHGSESIPTNTQQNPDTERSIRSLLTKATEYASGSVRITRLINSYDKNRRYVHLKTQEIYDSLVSLYSHLFQTQWHIFKRASEGLTPQNTPPQDIATALARVYVSHWFVDLYQSVRTSLARISHIAMAEHYSQRLFSSSYEYDAFLGHLNTSMRPTHISGCYEDVMFIPRLCDEVDLGHPENPFGLTNFSIDLARHMAIINAFKNKQCTLRMTSITTETVGRPFWLFDWHDECRVCSWFPMEGNFTSEDIMYAFIIGVACTPKLAPQDVETVVIPPATFDATTKNWSVIRFTDDRHFFGDYEVTSYNLHAEKFYIPELSTEAEGSDRTTGKRLRTDRDTRDYTQPSASRAQTPGGNNAENYVDQILVERKFYIYYARIILNMNDMARQTAHVGLLNESGLFRNY